MTFLEISYFFLAFSPLMLGAMMLGCAPVRPPVNGTEREKGS